MAISRAAQWISTLLLGNPGETSVGQDRKQWQMVEVYGLCIGVLLASTRTYVEHKIDILPPTEMEARASLDNCLARINSLLGQFAKVRQAEATCRKTGVTPDIDERKLDLFEHYVEIDAQLIAIIPDDFLVARRWILLDRMRRIAPQKALIEYEGSLPPSMDKGKRDDADKIRADLLSLSTYMQQLYVLNTRREETLASIKWWLLSRTMGVVLIVALIFLLATTQGLRLRYWGEMPWMPIAMLILFLTGMIGAVVSISRKFQDIGGQNILVGDPFNELVSLNFSRESVACSITAGGVFALVLYLTVVSGATDLLGLNLRFFPSLAAQRVIVDLPQEKPALSHDPPQSAVETPDREQGGIAKLPYVLREPDHVPPGIGKLSRSLGFFYDADILRMMLLAFLAGFAERLVPDSIDRLVRKEKAVKDAAV